jgi:HD-GYP domain-containing protein (c-di-GMP phosphodiesterase class II)
VFARLAPSDSAAARKRVRDHRAALAAAVRVKSYALAAGALARSVRRPEMNIGLELTALSFVERFAGSVASGDWSTLLKWVDATCERYGDMTVIPRLLCAATSTLASAVSELNTGAEGRGSEFAGVEEEIERIARRPRLAAPPAGTDTLDEIDVVLGELVSRLEESDPLTAEHSRAVSVWCARIGRRMALSVSETIYISRCGLIHDIGKITTPPEILKAPRRLSDTEMNVMRRHAEDGGAIITGIPLLAHHTPAVRGHHERLDGRGYPDGLTSTQIPLASRIVAVADSFNAMIGNRPYRLPMRPTAALEELQRHAGAQFDPEVVDAMHDVVNHRT